MWTCSTHSILCEKEIICILSYRHTHTHIQFRVKECLSQQLIHKKKISWFSSVWVIRKIAFWPWNLGLSLTIVDLSLFDIVSLWVAIPACCTFGKCLRNYIMGWPEPCEQNWVDRSVWLSRPRVLSILALFKLLIIPDYRLSPKNCN